MKTNNDKRYSSFQDFVDFFLDFEISHNMFGLTWNGNTFWQYIRFKIFMDLASYLSIIENYEIDGGRTYYEESFFEAINRKTLWNMRFSTKRRILVIPDRRLYREKGKYRDIYTDSICRNLRLPYGVLYFGDIYGNMLPLDLKNVIYADVDGFKKKYKNNIAYPKIDEKWFYDNITKRIEGYLSIKIPDRIIYSWLSNLYYCVANRKFYKEYYSYIIDKIRPKVILITESYSYNKMILCETSRLFNTEIIELQHGYAGRAHFGYNYPKCISNPSWFPNYFFSFGEIEHNTRFPLMEDKVIPVGFPELEANIRNDKKKNQVLFLSEPSIELAELALEFEKLIGNNISIVYKLHPLEVGKMDGFYGDRFTETNIEIADTMEKTIHEYLSESEWVVGISSTGLYEATAFKCKIAVYKKKGYEKSQSLYENQYATLIDDAHHLASLIEGDCGVRCDTELFFKKNSIGNILKEIDSIEGNIS